MNRLFIILFLVPVSLKLMAQEENPLIRRGNDKYIQKKYEDAQVDYLAALDKNSDSFKARFNLSDAYYKQKKYENALKELYFLSNKEKDKMRLAGIYHNMGNCYFRMRKLNEAEDAYKKSLRNNPSDMDTKFNLAFVKRNKNQAGGNNGKDKNDDKKQKKEDKKNNNDQKQKQQKQQQQQPQNKLSKEDADRMLDAMQQDEKNTLEKVKQQPKTKARSVKIEKAW